jgi:coproporphyrinogen III oxidase-like Fe-S oxidoreductase/sulfatase maturation enzyme AslB (radical SAM superfamily)
MEDETLPIHRMHAQLPIFRLDRHDHSILYTAGQLAIIDPLEADRIEAAWRSNQSLSDRSRASRAAEWISHQAAAALKNHRHRLSRAFQPECLTLYLSNICNMRCTYCFTAPHRSGNKGRSGSAPTVIDPATVAAAAKTVIDACAENHKPFQLVLHGGGEPTLHWPLIKTIVRQTRHMAHQRQVGWRGHIATNGMLTQEQAQWLGRRFHSIGLSCDGPPDIQDRQRPLKSGRKSSDTLARSAAAILATNARLTVRTTITPATLTRQREIVSYLHHQLGVRHMRFEPAYRLSHSAGGSFSDEQADLFCRHFIQAQRKAGQLGSALHYSGLRLDEPHGPYCNVLRQVLHLMPDGRASACFFCTDASTPGNQAVCVGRMDDRSEQFKLDLQAISRHRQAASETPYHCRQCINQLHCTYGCPDRCNIRRQRQPSAADPDDPPAQIRFRCRVNRRLARHWIFAEADRIIGSQTPPLTRRALADRPRSEALDNHLEQIPTGIDTAAIRRNYDAVKEAYPIQARKMPDPPWMQREYDHTGEAVWRLLQTDRAATSNKGPLSIYLHIPFCQGRCRFCDCHAVGLKQRHHDVEQRFTQVLMEEMPHWSQLPGLRNRPVTTVHLGGGTPNCIHPERLQRIVRGIGRRFNCTAATEWAIESTVRRIDWPDLIALSALGFRRLHVGVQTLNDQERQTIGRKHDYRIVLQRLQLAIEMGFVTSVDIIYGLPGQNAKSLIRTLDHLTGIGIHGISLYRLNRSPRNKRFFNRLYGFHPDALADFVMFQAADQLLIRRGYAKNHFCHYALPEDENLYANHARRGEDLVALGPTADGILDPYHFRHPGHLSPADLNRRPPLEGGIYQTQTAAEQHRAPLCIALLSARVDHSLFTAIDAEGLLEQWMTLRLMEDRFQKKSYALSANGSWLVREMLDEVAGWGGRANGIIKRGTPV